MLIVALLLVKIFHRILNLLVINISDDNNKNDHEKCNKNDKINCKMSIYKEIISYRLLVGLILTELFHHQQYLI